MRNTNHTRAALAPLPINLRYAPLVIFELPLVVYRDDPEVWDEWDRITAGLDKLSADGRAQRLAELDSRPGDEYRPACLMRWSEQVQGADDMGDYAAGKAG